MAPSTASDVPTVRARSSGVDECAVSTASHHQVVAGVTPFGPSVSAACSSSAGRPGSARIRPRPPAVTSARWDTAAAAATSATPPAASIAAVRVVASEQRPTAMPTQR